MADKFKKFAGIFPIERAATTKNATSVTLEELAQADYAVEQALKFFNYAPLVNRLRSAEPFRLELNVAADIISGKARGQNTVWRSPKHYALGNFI